MFSRIITAGLLASFFLVLTLYFEIYFIHFVFTIIALYSIFELVKLSGKSTLNQLLSCILSIILMYLLFIQTSHNTVLYLSYFAFLLWSLVLISLLFKITFILAIIGSLFFFIGSMFFAGVGFTPYDVFFDLHVFFALNSFRLMIPASLIYLIVFLRSSLSIKYIAVIASFLFLVTAYVIYLNIGENPLSNKEAMIASATIQKFIAFMSVATVFSLSFGFSKRINNSK